MPRFVRERVARLGEVDFGRQQHERGGQRQPFVACAQHQRGGEVAARRAAADDDALRRLDLEQPAVHGDAVVERGGIGMVGRHAVVDRPRVHPHDRRDLARHRRHASPPPMMSAPPWMSK